MDGTGEARMDPMRGRAKRVAKNFMMSDVWVCWCVVVLVWKAALIVEWMHLSDSRRRVYIVEQTPLKDKTKSESHVL
jgi:hypothetical protein